MYCTVLLVMFLIVFFSLRLLMNRQRNETEQALRLLKRCLVLNPHYREALHLLRWIQVEHHLGADEGSVEFDEVDVDKKTTTTWNYGATRTVGHYSRSPEKSSITTIGSFSDAHQRTPPASNTPPPAAYWIAANRLQQQRQKPKHQQSQREESRQHHASGTTNYGWNKTASKN